MGGLLTIIKVRDQLENYEGDPGWYKHPPGTVALKASDEELRRDGIDVSKLMLDDSAKQSVEKKANGHAGH